MSGANNQGPPTRLTPIAGDMPIAQDRDGNLLTPTPYFFQCIQRILSYLGQPGQGNENGEPSNNGTISEQLDQLANIVAGLVVSPGTAAPGLDGRIADLEKLLRTQPWLLPSHPPGPSPAQWISPGVNRGLTNAQVLARIWFGG
jgi:hypothetical protein